MGLFKRMRVVGSGSKVMAYISEHCTINEVTHSFRVRRHFGKLPVPHGILGYIT